MTAMPDATVVAIERACERLVCEFAERRGRRLMHT